MVKCAYYYYIIAALINRMSILGFGRTSGWEVPLSRLMQKNIMVRDCTLDLTTIERDISSAHLFFGPSCIPGNWAPDTATDGEYSNNISSNYDTMMIRFRMSVVRENKDCKRESYSVVCGKSNNLSKYW